MKKRYKRIVAKLGTNLITSEDRLDMETLGRLVAQVAQLRRSGVEVIVVTSGAVAAGRSRLGVTRRRRRDIPYRQVLASVGQGQLMQAYDTLFAQHDIVVAQALLTRRDLADRLSYLNARNTLLALLSYNVVPIVNENDAVAVEELAESRIGENDTLGGADGEPGGRRPAGHADDARGLYTADPSIDPSATLVKRVDTIDASIEAYAGKSETGGSGGMITKLQAARLSTSSGTDVVIASGREPDILPRLVAGEALGTFFPAAADRLESRKRWILSGLSIRGSLVVDDGAEKALRERKTSLLPAGVKEVCGTFARGETIEVVTISGTRLGSGIANYSSEEMDLIKGAKSTEITSLLGYDYGAEAVHRDNLVVT